MSKNVVSEKIFLCDINNCVNAMYKDDQGCNANSAVCNKLSRKTERKLMSKGCKFSLNICPGKKIHREFCEIYTQT